MTNNPQRYRHRTPEIEAVQWTGDNADEMRAFVGADFDEIDPEDRAENPDATAAVRESKHGTWRGLEPGDWVVKIGDEFYEESDADFAASFEPVVPPATDRAALRDRIADTVTPFLANFSDEETAKVNAREVASAVLAVLPPTADRGAEIERLREQMEEAEDTAEQLVRNVQTVARERESYRKAWKEEQQRRVKAEHGLRRVADEEQPSPRCTCGETACESELCDCDSPPCPVDHADEAQQQKPTPCGPMPDQCDDEPCANHEREHAHTEGEHCFCGPECVEARQQPDTETPLEKRLRYSERRNDELRTECRRRGKTVLEQSEKIRALEREIDGVRRQLGAEILRANQIEAETAPVSPAYARLQVAAKAATEAAHLHAMHGMKRTFQLCQRYGNEASIPAAEVLNALGLDENANTVEPAVSGPGGVADENPAETRCTCGVAGDAFVPLGHYADCPQYAPAVVAQPGKET